MNFELLNQIGFSNIDYSYLFLGLGAACLLMFIIIIILIIKFSGLKKKYVKFMGGKEVKTMEEQLLKIFEENNYLRELSEDNKKEIKNIKKEMEFTFNKVGIVKYDAFKQMGGMLSFSIALLNEKDNGFILNSVHSSEGCYSYIKEIKAGLCEIELSNEEKEALSQAMNKS